MGRIPKIYFVKIVFPLPDSPIKPMISPSSISKEIFLETLKKNINNFLKAEDRDFKLNLPISYKNHYKVKI